MMVVGLALMGLTYGPLGTVLSELFPTAVRYTGSSLTYNFAGIFGASLAPYIATWLATNYGPALRRLLPVGVGAAVAGRAGHVAGNPRYLAVARPPVPVPGTALAHLGCMSCPSPARRSLNTVAVDTR